MSSIPGDWPQPLSSTLTTAYSCLVQNPGSGVSHAECGEWCSCGTSLNESAWKLKPVRSIVWPPEFAGQRTCYSGCLCRRAHT